LSLAEAGIRTWAYFFRASYERYNPTTKRLEGQLAIGSADRLQRPAPAAIGQLSCCVDTIREANLATGPELLADLVIGLERDQCPKLHNLAAVLLYQLDQPPGGDRSDSQIVLVRKVSVSLG
jgi:hypothetical protein